jgi:hypothetical protein
MNVNTVHSLIKSLDGDAIVGEVERLYQEGFQDDYRDAVTEICKMTPSKTDLCCVLGKTFDLSDQAPLIDVYGKYLGDDQRWGLSCTSWEEWLAMPVLTEPEVGSLSDLETAAHILYEMTWGGWGEDDVTEKREYLTDLMDEVHEAIEAGDTSKFRSIDLLKPN